MTAELAAWFREPRDERRGPRAGRRLRRRRRTTPWTPIIFARTLLPLVQLPPAGHWDDTRRAGFVLDPRPLPGPGRRGHARARALPGRLRARRAGATSPRGRASPSATSRRRGSGSRRSPTATSTAASCSTSRRTTAARRDAAPGAPARPLGPAAARLRRPRARSCPPEIQALQLTLSGDPTVTVDGRVAASWAIERRRARQITPHVELSPRAAGRDPGGGAANGPLLRREDREGALERQKPPRGGLYSSLSASAPKNLSPLSRVGALPLIPPARAGRTPRSPPTCSAVPRASE